MDSDLEDVIARDKKNVLYHIRQTLSFVLPTTSFVLSEKASKEHFISSPHGDQMFLVLIIFFQESMIN